MWLLYSGPVGEVPSRSGTGDVNTEVETDVSTCRRPAVVTRRLIPLAGDGRRAVVSDVPGLVRRRELLEQVFDNGMAVFKCVSFE